MKSYSNVYIGFIDILGFSNMKKNLDRFGDEASTAIISKMFTSLEQIVQPFSTENMTWINVQDSFLCYSHDDSIDHLVKIIKDSCYLISMALTQSIPLRCAITQGDIQIETEKGFRAFGSGFDLVMELEKIFNWMGGLVYIQNLNDPEKKINKLIETTHIVIEQNSTHQCFKAPLNEKEKLSIVFNNNNSWFLNWHKLLHSSEEDVRKQIKGWFSQFHINSSKIDEELGKEIIEKQEHSIAFANYCISLYEACLLIYHSKINREIDIGKIQF